MNATAVTFETAAVGDVISFVRIIRGFMPDIQNVSAATIVRKTARTIVAETSVGSQYTIRASQWYEYEVRAAS